MQPGCGHGVLHALGLSVPHLFVFSSLSPLPKFSKLQNDFFPQHKLFHNNMQVYVSPEGNGF